MHRCSLYLEFSNLSKEHRDIVSIAWFSTLIVCLCYGWDRNSPEKNIGSGQLSSRGLVACTHSQCQPNTSKHLVRNLKWSHYWSRHDMIGAWTTPGMSGDYSDQTTRAHFWIQRFALLIRTSLACLVQHLAALPSLISLVFAQKPTFVILLAASTWLVFKRWKQGRHCWGLCRPGVKLPKHDFPQVLWC